MAIALSKTKKTIKKPILLKEKKTQKTTEKKTKSITVIKAKPLKKTQETKQLKPFSEKLTKSQIITHLSNRLELEKKTIKLFFSEILLLIEANLVPRGFGEITLPIGLKIKRQEKPAQKARMGRNPFTGKEVMFKAKPKRKIVKAQSMKLLKEILNK